MSRKENNYWKIYMITIVGFLVGTSQFVIAGIIDKVAISLGVSVSLAGQLITAFSLANAIGTPIIMIILAKMDRRKQLLLSLVIFLVGIVSTLFLPGFGLMVISRVILGVGSGVFSVTAYSIAANLAPVGGRGKAMSNVAMGYSASLVFGVPIGRVIAAAYDWKIILWGIGILSLISFFAIKKTIPAMETEAVVPLGEQLALLKRPNISLALCVTLLFYIGYSVVNTYIAPFMSAVMPISEQAVSVILFILGIASLVGSKFGGFLADRIGSTRTIFGGLLVQVLSLVIISMISGTELITIPSLIVWMLTAWIFGSTQIFNVVSIASEASGIALSLNTSFTQLGFALGASIGGIVVGSVSIKSISWVSAICAIFAILVFCISNRIASNIK